MKSGFVETLQRTRAPSWAEDATISISPASRDCPEMNSAAWTVDRRVGRTNDIHGGSSFAAHSYFTLDENCKLFVCEDPPASCANSTHPTKSGSHFRTVPPAARSSSKRTRSGASKRVASTSRAESTRFTAKTQIAVATTGTSITQMTGPPPRASSSVHIQLLICSSEYSTVRYLLIQKAKK